MFRRRKLQFPEAERLESPAAQFARDPSPTNLLVECPILLSNSGEVRPIRQDREAIRREILEERNSEGKRERGETEDSPSPVMPSGGLDCNNAVSATTHEAAVDVNPGGDAETVQGSRLELGRAVAAVVNYDRKARLQSLASARTISSPSEDSDDFDPSLVRFNSEAALQKLTIPRLKQVLRFHNLPISGNKQALISRLLVSCCKNRNKEHTGLSCPCPSVDSVLFLARRKPPSTTEAFFGFSF